MKIQTSYYTSKGSRENNEDYISLLKDKDNNQILAIVADGLGGEDAGELASKMAVERIDKQLTGKQIDAEILKESLEEANYWIYQRQSTAFSMKTTIAVLWMDAEIAFSAHVGDSRVYQFRDSEIVYQSADHSLSQLAVMVGEIKKEEIRTHIDRNKLVRALGAKEEVSVEIKQLLPHKRDSFLLCTDGFWEDILEQEMILELDKAKTARHWMKKMRNRIKHNPISDEQDNNSAIAIIV